MGKDAVCVSCEPPLKKIAATAVRIESAVNHSLPNNRGKKIVPMAQATLIGRDGNNRYSISGRIRRITGFLPVCHNYNVPDSTPPLCHCPGRGNLCLPILHNALVLVQVCSVGVPFREYLNHPFKIIIPSSLSSRQRELCQKQKNPSYKGLSLKFLNLLILHFCLTIFYMFLQIHHFHEG